MNDHYYDCTEDVRRSLPLPKVHLDTGPKTSEEWQGVRARLRRTLYPPTPGNFDVGLARDLNFMMDFAAIMSNLGLEKRDISQMGYRQGGQ